jgi:hypothetical protein
MLLSTSRMALSTLSVSSVGVLVMEGVLVCPEEVSLEKVLSDPRPSREETSVSPHKRSRGGLVHETTFDAQPKVDHTLQPPCF